MRFWIGTSGFAYKEWKGAFYPKDLKNDDMLTYYGERMNAVEINNTFYRMPRREVLEGWTERVPDDFRFVLKASRRITHHSRLKESARDPLDYLLGVSAALGARRGPLLFQLPPNFKKDVDRLATFLELLPASLSAAFEFRHESWFDPDVIDILRSAGAALVVADTEDGETPVEATGGFGYARLRRDAYDEGALARWVETFRSKPWTDCYVFFKHEDEGTGPALAARFQALVQAG